jgi:hypothetical protein
VCVAGALCFTSVGSPDSCVQLCTNVGAAGQAPCKADQTCDSLFGEALEGYCGLADGGLGG